MNAAKVQRNYIILTLLNTLSTSVVWGINTIFLLDAGLSNFEAFLANAFFTAGMVLFEIPTGIVADTVVTASLLFDWGFFPYAEHPFFFYYYLWFIEGPFLLWLFASLLLGLGFTFFSGAIEAWFVQASCSLELLSSFTGQEMKSLTQTLFKIGCFGAIHRFWPWLESG